MNFSFSVVREENELVVPMFHFCFVPLSKAFEVHEQQRYDPQFSVRIHVEIHDLLFSTEICKGKANFVEKENQNRRFSNIFDFLFFFFFHDDIFSFCFFQRLFQFFVLILNKKSMEKYVHSLVIEFEINSLSIVVYHFETYFPSDFSVQWSRSNFVEEFESFDLLNLFQFHRHL